MTSSASNATDEAIELAGSLEDADDIQGAIDVLSDSVRTDPKNARLRAHRGRLYYLIEQWERAIREFDVALSIRPDAATTLFFRARARSMFGDLDGGLDDYRACVDVDPDSADAIYEIALIYEYQGKLESALEALNQAILVAGGSFRDAEERKVDLEERVGRRGA